MLVHEARSSMARLGRKRTHVRPFSRLHGEGGREATDWPWRLDAGVRNPSMVREACQRGALQAMAKNAAARGDRMRRRTNARSGRSPWLYLCRGPSKLSFAKRRRCRGLARCF